ncbi:hypothetical protein ZEAMMB73_Zm00001d040709 [Zea mays]|uniref:Uncharacterized protein n=1 Tax=Zea mays TaxID=4577 RepID=A0A1D6MSC7_MAIZE|nr:hypothetical protein ZEAMMB73_Zm00001d040709 [Zea mays]
MSWVGSWVIRMLRSVGREPRGCVIDRQAIVTELHTSYASPSGMWCKRPPRSRPSCPARSLPRPMVESLDLGPKRWVFLCVDQATRFVHALGKNQRSCLLDILDCVREAMEFIVQRGTSTTLAIA